MRIAILGATSQIAKDLIISFSENSNHDLILFARRPDLVIHWLTTIKLKLYYKILAIQYSLEQYSLVK